MGPLYQSRQTKLFVKNSSQPKNKVKIFRGTTKNTKHAKYLECSTCASFAVLPLGFKTYLHAFLIFSTRLVSFGVGITSLWLNIHGSLSNTLCMKLKPSSPTLVSLMLTKHNPPSQPGTDLSPLHTSGHRAVYNRPHSFLFCLFHRWA